MHGPHGGVVLRAHLGERAAALLDVPLHSAHEPDVGVGVDEELEVHLRAQPLVGQDPLDQHDGGGSDPPGPCGGRPRKSWCGISTDCPARVAVL